MAAHLRPIGRPCTTPNCTRPAVVQLWTTDNDLVDLPDSANAFLEKRWHDGQPGEPFTLEIEVPAWVVDLVRDERPLLTLREAADKLGVKPATLRELAGRDASEDENSPRARRLKAVKLGRDWFVDRAAVEAEVNP